MHMAMVIGGGLGLLALFLLFGNLWAAAFGGPGVAAKAFLPVWLALTVVNLWVGVAHAGYSVREELPILAIVFAVPALAAGLAIWHYARA